MDRHRVNFAPVDAPHEFVAMSEEIVVQGNGRPIEVIIRAVSVTLPRAGGYEFDLLANGKRVKAQALRFGAGRA